MRKSSDALTPALQYALYPSMNNLVYKIEHPTEHQEDCDWLVVGEDPTVASCESTMRLAEEVAFIPSMFDDEDTHKRWSLHESVELSLFRELEDRSLEQVLRINSPRSHGKMFAKEAPEAEEAPE